MQRSTGVVIGFRRPTFHLSISSCLDLYCFSNSSRTCFRPSEFVFNAGNTSFTVLSTKTPFVRRKHLRSFGSGTSVSATSLPVVDQLHPNCGVQMPSLLICNKISHLEKDRRSAADVWKGRPWDFLYAAIPMLINVLLDLTNFLGERLKRILVVRVLGLQVWLLHQWTFETLLDSSSPCCFFMLACCEAIARYIVEALNLRTQFCGAVCGGPSDTCANTLACGGR